jgi:pimeloyl-ACP methyl ester carboxylesterase
MEALPRDGEPFVILGESFSGPLAAMAAATRPAGLAGLILCATFLTPPWPMVRPIIRLTARPMWFRLYLPFKRARARIGGYATSERRALMAQLNEQMCPDVIAARVKMVFDVDARQALGTRDDLPMLYLRATRDLLVPAWNLRAIRRIRSNIQVATFPTTHMVLQRCAPQTAAAIAAFAAPLCGATD